MQLHKTKGIVLRTVKYGESSIITTVLTELFGMQSYIVKGARQSSKKSQGKANFFQPAAILDMMVYHNELKQLQFIKEYQWAYLYNHVLFDVVKNTVAMYIVELLQHLLKEPEANPDLFYLTEEILLQLDKGSNALTANLPLYFTLQAIGKLGFQIQGHYSNATPFFDLTEGSFCTSLPEHNFYLSNELAESIGLLNNVQDYNGLEKINFTRPTRIQLLIALQQYIKLHNQDFDEMRSIAILQEILS
jgi:DNA repair protein RecO (recombination protein O)